MTIKQDLRYALRLLVRRPSFSLIVIGTLALGIGANAALFSVINAALLRPLAVRAPHELVNVYTTRPDGTGSGAVSFPDYLDLQTGATAFDGVLGYSGLMATMTGEGQAEVLFGELVTGNYFDVLGVRAQIGRTFAADEDRTPGTHPVVVIGHRLWQRRFAGDPRTVGRQVTLNGRPYTVVGVAPKAFTGLLFRGLSVDVWAPAMMMGQLRTDQLSNRDERWMFVKGRLAPGQSIAQAEAAARSVAANLRRAYPASNEGRSFNVIASDDVFVNPDGDRAIVPAAAFLLLAAGLVLLITCANVANLMLARAAGRRRELTVRLALGAGRGQIIRQLLVESAVLAAAGGVVGLLLAAGMAAAIVSYRPPLPVPIALDVAIDVRVALYVLVLTAISTVCVGLLPALRIARPQLMSVLKDDRGGSSRRRFGLRNWLLVPQVAVSLILLVMATLFARSVARAGAVDPGFDASRVAVVALNLGMSGYDEARARAFYSGMREQLAAQPGVVRASLTNRIPLDIYGSQSVSLRLEGEDAAAVRTAQHASVDADYFAALGIPLLRGRAFTAADLGPPPQSGAGVPAGGTEQSGTGVPAGQSPAGRTPGGGTPGGGTALVSAAAARAFWPNDDPIGKRIRVGEDQSHSLEVIGVVGDVKVQSLGEPPQAMVYEPLASGHTRLLRVLVQTADSPAALVPELRRLVGRLDAGVAIFENRTLAESIGVMLYPFEMASRISSALGVFALVLAAVGLYGVMAYSVSARMREIGIRLAIGAQPRDLLRGILGQDVRAVAIGMAAGLVVSALMAQAIAGLLFGITPLDPVTFAAVPAVLLTVSLLAALAPARRALSVDPIRVLRDE